MDAVYCRGMAERPADGKSDQAAYGYFCWNLPDGTKVSWDKAVYSVTNISAGDSTGVAPLEFEIASNGKPKITAEGQAASVSSTGGKASS